MLSAYSAFRLGLPWLTWLRALPPLGALLERDQVAEVGTGKAAAIDKPDAGDWA